MPAATLWPGCCGAAALDVVRVDVPRVVYGHVASKGASQVLYVFRGMSEMVGCCFQLRGCW